MNSKNLPEPMEPRKTGSSSRAIFRIAICFTVLLAGIFGMTALASLKKPPAEVHREERALRVTAVRAEVRNVPVEITGYGEVRVLNSVFIAPEVAGKIVAVHPGLEPGEIVSKGEMLFQIDPRDYETGLREAEAAVRQGEMAVARLVKQSEIDAGRLDTLERNRELAQTELDRFRSLLIERKVGSQSAVDKAEQAFISAKDIYDQMAQTVALYPIRIKEAKASLQAAKARRLKAKTQLQRCTVKAPFTARLTDVSIEKDQYVSPGKSVLTLADDSVLEIHLPIDSVDARRWLKFDSAASDGRSSDLEPVVCRIFWTEDKSGEGWQGRLDRVIAFDPKTRTLTVAVRIDSQREKPGAMPLMEGMFCEVKIPGKTIENVVALPRQAVTMDQTVYIADGNRLKTVPVKVARYEGETAYIGEGISENDRVVTTRLIDPLENSLLTITGDR